MKPQTDKLYHNKPIIQSSHNNDKVIELSEQSLVNELNYCFAEETPFESVISKNDTSNLST